jgi:hypothetical protein
MRKKIEREVTFCDKCGKEQDYGNTCDSCGVEMCYDCQEKHGVKYSHGVYFFGSGDGFYCKPCDNRLVKTKASPRHNALIEIKSLRKEQEVWSEDFRKRQEKAEKLVGSLKE